MTSIAHTITAEEADFLRSLWRNGYLPLVGDQQARSPDLARLWRPIECVVATSGRSHCRLCAALIPEGEAVIRFGFDPYGDAGWGRLANAYLHLTCPTKEA